jgi:uncharacterized glyoxalase superfamily protein PhnB
MMKSGELLVIVESVEEAIKFYTEKLAFDITGVEASKDSANTLHSAHLRKGKCGIVFRTPLVEELAEFSFIKRCGSRCIGFNIEMKKGLDKYFQRCQKKGLKTTELKERDGYQQFVIRDPFGTKLVFSQLIGSKPAKPTLDFLGLHLTEQDITGKGRKEVDIIDDMVEQLRTFGILRRAAKKYAKTVFKQLTTKSK